MRETKEQLYNELTQPQESELLSALFEPKSSDPSVLAFLSYVTKYMQLHNMALPIHFAADHPVEEAGRYILHRAIRPIEI